jgi:hypothetical protein
MAFGGGFVKKENDGYLGKKLRLEKPKNQFPETPIKAQNPYYDAIFCIPFYPFFLRYHKFYYIMYNF